MFHSLLTALLLMISMSSAAPDVGIVVLEPSSTARVVELPRTGEKQITLGIYNNTELLSEQLKGVTARWLDEIHTQSVGGGTWFVTLYLNNPNIELSLTKEKSRYVVRLVRTGSQITVPEPRRSLEALISGKIDRTALPPGPTPIRLLDGDASPVRLDPRALTLTRAKWQAPTVPAPFSVLLNNQEEANWNQVANYRRALVLGHGPVRDRANYLLGEAHLELGLPREARYYFNAVAASHPDSAALHMARAQAALAIGSYEETQTLCVVAAHAGAPDRDVLFCLAAVSLATAEIPPTQVARALIETTSSPIAQLLAANLLSMDMRHKEAAELLNMAVGRLKGHELELALLALGDANFALGKLDLAKEAWGRAQPQNDLSKWQVNLRLHLLTLVESGPVSWAEAIPALTKLSVRSDIVGAEVKYILSQVFYTYGDSDFEAEWLTRFIDQHHRVASRTDALRRLTEVNMRRMEQLYRDGMYVELAAWYSQYWNSNSEQYLIEPNALEGVAKALMEMGLHQQALQVQLDVTRLLAQNNAERPRSILLLAQMYWRASWYPETLKSVAYTRKMKGAGPYLGQLNLIEGLALEAMGQQKKAVALYTKLKDPLTAGIRRGVLLERQGKYDQAVVFLQAAHDSGEPLSAEIELSFARCLFETGASDKALVILADIIKGGDEGVLSAARYLRGVVLLGKIKDGSDLQEDILGQTGVWKSLLDREVSYMDLKERLDAR